ncbi:uncharacterized protein GGS22DRAFT_182878 [Annulohypoxylon maeteangense]|uniref:uncharacterized protein n=1 Tax=Annulohypoxylon maeteangense TaxID=1927788 RepID=UPI002007B8F7|nr:uncharacterized protein GGS22DRAFT_182878 [Annulohypoxylon maeteangense]KAI0889534.1 hypothetical protein GGS22DRAFT_182878 [Annulohypoxylon maeteangense]
MAGCVGGFSNFMARLLALVEVKSKPSTPSEKAPLQISAPFNFKHETVSLPGVSEDEIAFLKEQAAAARLGVADPSAIGNPRKAPAPPTLRPVTPILKVTPSTPISPADNLI